MTGVSARLLKPAEWAYGNVLGLVGRVAWRPMRIVDARNWEARSLEIHTPDVRMRVSSLLPISWPHFSLVLVSSAGVHLFRVMAFWLSFGIASWRMASRGILNPVVGFRELHRLLQWRKKRKISIRK